MRRLLSTTYIYILMCAACFAQGKEVQNKPYIDLRPLHFGVLVGMHTQDVELSNVGMQTITLADGTQQEQLISCDQNAWDMGFTVGVLAEARIDKNFAFRLAPSLYFGNRHLYFLNHSEKLADGTLLRENQDMKTVYIATAAEVIFAAQRLNNTRPYLVAGVCPMLNLVNSKNDILRFKPMDCCLELGLGCDFYLPFFKLRPELKFMYSLTDVLDKNHPADLKDLNKRKYATSVSSAHTKMIALTFYFE